MLSVLSKSWARKVLILPTCYFWSFTSSGICNIHDNFLWESILNHQAVANYFVPITHSAVQQTTLNFFVSHTMDLLVEVWTRRLMTLTPNQMPDRMSTTEQPPSKCFWHHWLQHPKILKTAWIIMWDVHQCKTRIGNIFANCCSHWSNTVVPKAGHVYEYIYIRTPFK